jgi:uncharacterized protein (TIGR00369 family)
MTGITDADQDTVVTRPAAGDARERTYTWSDPLQTAAAGMGLSGAEFFAEMTAGRVPWPPIMDTLGLDSFAVEDGTVEFRLTPREFHYNPIGSVHGGVFAAMLDSACGCAVHFRLPAGVYYTSLDLSVKFLRPVSVDTGQITAAGSVVHLGRRTALAEGRITDATGRILATATSSCLVMRPE